MSEKLTPIEILKTVAEAGKELKGIGEKLGEVIGKGIDKIFGE